jgi:hypothetical protein
VARRVVEDRAVEASPRRPPPVRRVTDAGPRTLAV